MAFITIFVCFVHISQTIAQNLLSGQNAPVHRPLSHCRHVVHLPLTVRAENFNSLIQSYKDGLTIILVASSTRMPQRLWDERASCLVHVISSSIDSVVGSFHIVAKFRQDDKAEYELFITLNSKTQFKLISYALSATLPYLQRGVSLWFQQTPNDWEIDYHIKLNYKEMHRLQFFCNSATLTCLSNIDLTSKVKIEPEKLNYFGWPLYVIYTDKHFKPSYDFPLIQKLPFWQLFTRIGNDFKMPIGKLCFDIAKYINATAKGFELEGDIPPEYLSLIEPDKVIAMLSNSSRPFVHSIEKLNFIYCKSRHEVISSGQLNLYLCPFDSATWLLIILSLAGTALTLKMSNGKSHILNLVRCLLLQPPEGGESLKKTVWVFFLWVLATQILSVLYTNCIESILVVPLTMSGPETFEELYRANYTIILPDSDDEFIDDIFRKDKSPFSGTFYLDKLRENAEYIPAPLGFPSPGFFEYAVKHEKRAMVFDLNDLEIVENLWKIYEPAAECKVGRELSMSEMSMWGGLGGHAAALRSILHRLFVGGIMKYMADGSHSALAKSNALYAPLVSHYDGVNGSVEREGFVMENAQFRMLFLSWLAGLGVSAVVFCIELQAYCCFCKSLFMKFLGNK